ncbi:MAG: hypothetical protein NWT00_09315 [Beijerinckiaceae bacterium]|jgi:tripartite-type tricarboxylate transporter receptor subunit TctC|nr:hypothetical protein [Beijerinckiaceae bacterium]
MSILNWRSAFGCAMSATLLAFSPAQAQDAASYYKGKTIYIIVGFGPGGGYDLYPRVLARHMSQYIPGNPKIIVQNMTGAGSMRAANHVYSNAPKDGTYIAAVNQNMPMYQLLGGKGATFKAQKLQFLGTIASSNGTLYTWHASKTKTIEDAKKHVTTMGGTSNRSDSFIFPTLLNKLIGTQFKVITGYTGGTKPIHLALERGEIDGRGGNSWASLSSISADWLRDKKLNILVQVGFEKEDELPNVPLLQDLVKPEDRAAVDVISLPTAIGYAHWLSPDAPADRVALLRKAYAKTVKDAGFLAEAKKLNILIKPKSGEQIEALVRRVAATPQPVLNKTAQLLGWQ